MSVPSYDDLPPGIPDVVDSEKVEQLTVFLNACQRPTPNVQRPTWGSLGRWELGIGNLYACLRRHDTTGDLPALLAVARDFSPRVRQAGEREVLLDVSGLGRLIGPPAEIERQLAQAVVNARVEACVAIAPTQTIARLLARAETSHGATLRPASAREGLHAGYGEVSPERLRREGGHKDHKGHEDHEVHTHSRCDLCDLRGLCGGACGRGPWLQLPVALLQALEALPPVNNHRDRARPYETLERWGIATLGELAALPAAELSSRLGRRGVALQRLARGLDAAPFVPDGETPRYIGRLELEWPIDALEPLSFVFARLLEPLAAALERADRGAAAVRLALRLTDRSTQTRLLQLPAPLRDPRVLRTLLLLDLESSPLFAASGQRGGGGAPPSEVMIDVVTIELDPAPGRITQFSLLQRALPSPETLATLTARLSALCGETRVGSPALLDSHRADAVAMTRYNPEQDAPGARGAEGAAVLRRRRAPVAICVAVECGRPVHVAASKRGVPSGAITEAAGPWRSSGEWWSERGWSRNEWDVALKSGAVCRIYQDRTTDRWFLEGMYD